MSELFSIKEASEKIIFTFTTDDLQSEAIDFIDRKLTEEEINKLKDLIQDSFSEYMMFTFPTLFENLKN